MAEHAPVQHVGSNVPIAVEVRHLGNVSLVPVLQRRVGITRTGTLESWSGHGDCRLVGVWVAPDGGTPLFLPAETRPPGRTLDWNTWLLDSPGLLASIATRLARSVTHE
jgi:hypothetical protein